MSQRPHILSIGMQWALALALPVLFAPGAQAQKMKTRMADRYAQVFDHQKVAKIYEDINARGKASVDDVRRLATSYEKIGESLKAEATYRKLVTMQGSAPNDMIAFADRLRANGNYDEAMTWYTNYAAVRPDDVRAAAYVKNPSMFQRMLADSNSATIRKLPINSDKADLGVSVMGDLLIFASARGEGTGGNRTYHWDNEPFLNLHSALLKGETAEEPKVMRKELNSRFHDGTATYDSTAKRLYFTRNNLNNGVLRMSDDGELKLGIYYSDVTSGEFGQPEWSSLAAFQYNNVQFNFGHPSIALDGSRLYFASDMPGGLGGADIWYCERSGSTWSAPKNLGAPANTPGNEFHPHISRTNALYFTSDGHPGLGGMDLYRAQVTENGPGRVYNLGYPMNTQWNDHGIFLVNDTAGFFVSNRPGGQGSDDIYGCTVRPPTMLLAGRVIDRQTKQPIPDAMIMVQSATGAPLSRADIEPLEGGKFKARVEYQEKYLVVANKNGYFQGETRVVTEVDNIEDIVVEMGKYDYLAEGLVIHGETGEPLAGSKVQLLDANEKVLAELVTDATGRYEFPLVPETDYKVRAEKDGFFKQSVRVSTKGKASARIRNDLSLFPLVVDQAVRLENIFYDYNKWNIRPDAGLELDKLVSALLENPTVKIELSSHTDCRGSDSYNLGLSEKRAKSAVDYIISKGVAKDRIKSKGYGETKPSENCKCEQCTEDQHQRNRRTEFKVLSL